MSNVNNITRKFRLIALSMLVIILTIIMTLNCVYGDTKVDIDRMNKLREEITLLKSEIYNLDKEIEKVEIKIDKLSEERARLKRMYKKNPSAINESKLNRVLSELRQEIEQKNKLELDKDMKSENLESMNRELIELINIEINSLLKEVKKLESEGDLITIDKKITKVLLLQEEKKQLYGAIDNTYPDIPDIELKVNPDDSEEVLTGKLKFVQDQLLLLTIANEKMEENRKRLLLEYEILQILIDFYPEDTPRKEEMFDQLEIISLQIEELNQKIENNNEKSKQLKELEEKLIEQLNALGG